MLFRSRIPGTGGLEKPEFSFDLSLGLKGGADAAGIVAAGVGGAISTHIDIDLADIPKAQVKRDASGQVLPLPDGVSLTSDGKIRGSEVITMLFYQGFNPLNLFNFDATVDFSGFIWGEAGIGLFKVGFEYELFRIRLLELSYQAPKVQPILDRKSTRLNSSH